MRGFGTTCIVAALMVCGVITPAFSQMRAGEVTGMVSGGVNKYSGEFTDDIWGANGGISLWYAPMNRLALEARFGLGEIGWKVSQADLNKYPEYFGAGAEIGDLYPGTLTPIESVNESRLTTIDLLVHYVLVDNIPAVPFITAGVGMVNYAPSTDETHEALPNYSAGVYSGSAFSIPLGGGVRIPFSDRVGLMLRGEYRLVWSKYLDDLSANGSNDAVTSVSLGLTYQFTDPAPKVTRRRHHHHPHHPHHQHHRQGCDCGCECHEEENEGMPEQRAIEKDPVIPSDSEERTTDTTKTDTKTDTKTNTKSDSTTDTQSPSESPSETPSETPSTTSSLTPCPAGTARVCVTANESVCVDTNITPGADRIKWEEAFIWEPGQGAHQQTMRAVNAEKPCYDIVVRQTASAYYMCKDCCFEKIKLGGQWVYVILDEGQISKGQGVFTPANCPDCDAVASSGR